MKPLVLSMTFVMSIAIAAQTGRDRTITNDTAPAGTARLAGLVVDAANASTPLRRVILTLTGAELPHGRAVISDDDGRFVFDRLPAGRYQLSATKPAYVAAAYGARRPGQPGVPLQINAGQIVDDVRVAMTRGAVVTGVLRDDAGQPVRNTRVAVYRVPRPGKPPNLALADIAMSDDRGAYRVFGLAPGTYVVSSTRPSGGRIGDVVALSSAEIDRALRDLQQRTASPAAAASITAAPPDAYAFAPIFYPGTSVASSATPLVLTAGEERSGIDFAVPFIRIAKIHGSVTYPAGPPPVVQFAIRTDGLRVTSLQSAVPVFNSVVEPPGRTFTYTNVAPGRYVIAVRTRSGDALYARTDVDVGGADVTGLSLQLRPTITLRGRVVFDGRSPTPTAPATIGITAAADAGGGASGRTQLGDFHIPPITAAADGTFTLPYIIPDAYRLTATVPASGWFLRSAIVNGRDVLDHGLDIAADGDIAGAVLTFSDRQSTLSGALVGAAGQAAQPYFIAVFPANRAMWRPDSRRIRWARAGTDGRWTIAGLPAGDYLIAAVVDLDPDDLGDATFLDGLLLGAVKTTLGEGEQKTQDLRVGGG